MSIILKDVEYAANLAKLKLSEEKKRRFQKELDSIIKYVDQLNELDTQNVPPYLPRGFFAECIEGGSGFAFSSQDKALANAPKKKMVFLRCLRL